MVTAAARKTPRKTGAKSTPAPWAMIVCTEARPAPETASREKDRAEDRDQDGAAERAEEIEDAGRGAHLMRRHGVLDRRSS